MCKRDGCVEAEAILNPGDIAVWALEGEVLSVGLIVPAKPAIVLDDGCAVHKAKYLASGRTYSIKDLNGMYHDVEVDVRIGVARIGDCIVYLGCNDVCWIVTGYKLLMEVQRLEIQRERRPDTAT